MPYCGWGVNDAMTHFPDVVHPNSSEVTATQVAARYAVPVATSILRHALTPRLRYNVLSEPTKPPVL